jgi:hypothetical protein
LSNPSLRAAYDEELFLQSIGEQNTRSERTVTTCCPVCNLSLARKPEPGEICPTCRTPLLSDLRQESGQTRGRSLERTKISDPVYYSCWPGKAKQGRMIDFSPKGMRFISGEMLAVGSILKISCRLFEASGTITNVSEGIADGMNCFSVGVCFLAVHFEKSRGTFLSTSA